MFDEIERKCCFGREYCGYRALGAGDAPTIQAGTGSQGGGLAVFKEQSDYESKNGNAAEPQSDGGRWAEFGL